MPWEYDNSYLESLCSTCHKKEHNIKPKKSKVVKPKKEMKVKKRIIKVKPLSE